MPMLFSESLAPVLVGLVLVCFDPDSQALDTRTARLGTSLMWIVASQEPIAPCVLSIRNGAHPRELTTRALCLTVSGPRYSVANEDAGTLEGGVQPRLEPVALFRPGAPNEPSGTRDGTDTQAGLEPEADLLCPAVDRCQGLAAFDTSSRSIRTDVFHLDRPARALIEALAPPTRDEFETTEEWRARYARAVSAYRGKWYAGWVGYEANWPQTGNSVLSRGDRAVYPAVHAAYDANSEMLAVYVPPSGLWILRTRLSWTTPPRESLYPGPQPSPGMRVEWPVSRERMQALSRNLIFMFVFKIPELGDRTECKDIYVDAAHAHDSRALSLDSPVVCHRLDVGNGRRVAVLLASEVQLWLVDGGVPDRPVLARFSLRPTVAPMR